MAKGKKNNDCGFGSERKITCRKCQKRFTVKIGNKNNGYDRVMKCPYCGTPNVFRIKLRD